MTTDPQQGGVPCSGTPALDDLLLESMPALLVFLRHQTGEELAARETVEDLAQSVCREVLQDQAALQFADRTRFRAYLFLQAARKVVDRARFHRMARRDSRREEPLPETRSAAEAGVYGTLVTGTQVAVARERMALVEKVLQQLPEGQREAVFLSRVAGLSYEAIASQKGVAESTIRALVARGLTRLCMELERRS
ncbi:MAG: sigma-70 family RNA polymerase sigma factor [Planctomycetes bacterium]|nr:sigma-70 family RNA polymerase sigma factor [Planctomycetota bacterium]